MHLFNDRQVMKQLLKREQAEQEHNIAPSYLGASSGTHAVGASKGTMS
jgi:hypothetical protein